MGKSFVLTFLRRKKTCGLIKLLAPHPLLDFKWWPPYIGICEIIIENSRVIISTVAFGMGMEVPDVSSCGSLGTISQYNKSLARDWKMR